MAEPVPVFVRCPHCRRWYREQSLQAHVAKAHELVALGKLIKEAEAMEPELSDTSNRTQSPIHTA